MHTRKPGFYERQYICRNVNKYYNNFNVTAQYNRYISPEHLSNALRRLILKNTSFALNFYRQDGSTKEQDQDQNGNNFEVKPVKKILFDDVVSFEEIPDEFNDQCLESINKLQPEMNKLSTPLWGVVVYKSESLNCQYICFYCDHTLFDGTSGVQFHRDLIVELEELSNASTLEKMQILFNYEDDRDDLPTKLSPALEMKTDLYHRPFFSKIINTIINSFWNDKTIGVLDALKKIFSSYFSELEIKKPRPFFEYNPVRPDIIHKYKIINFTPTEVKKILAFCKSEGTTLTPYIGTIGIHCLNNTIIPVCTGGEESITSLRCSINGRRFFPEIQDELKYGVCVSTTQYEIEPLENSSIVSKVRCIGDNLRKTASTKEVFWTTGDKLKETNFWDSFKKTVGGKRRETLYTSNLGQVSIKAGDLEVTNIWFSQSNGIAFHFVFSVVSSVGGGLNICLGYLPEYGTLKQKNSAEFAIDEFVKKFKTGVLDFNLYK
ncbi:hypothetical protein CAAN3_29S00100 [[Candida] anglica]